MAGRGSVRLRRWSFAIGTSIVAMAASSAANAQCSPDPATSSTLTTCTGTDNDGLIANSFSGRVLVAEGANVRGGSDAAISTKSSTTTFTINGRVDGESRIGFLVTNGEPYLGQCDRYAGPSPIFCSGLQTYYPWATATISVGAAGTISGAQGLVSRRSPNNNIGQISVSIANEGLIEGTSGTAVRDASGRLIVNNKTGATIRGVGYAIDTDGALLLTNAGTIDGSVISRVAAGADNGSNIDTLAGTIRGDLMLGAGDDRLTARYVAGQVVTGITGTIDGGAGVDTLDMRLSGDASFTALPLLPGFEILGLRMENAPTVTIGTADSVVTGMVDLSGNGTVTINGVLNGTGQLLAAGSYGSYAGAPVIVNAGTMQNSAGATNGYLARIFSANRFQNDGLIAAAGNGVLILSQGMFVDTGTLQARETALELSGTGFTNSETIRSTAGIGAIMSGSWVRTGATAVPSKGPRPGFGSPATLPTPV